MTDSDKLDLILARLDEIEDRLDSLDIATESDVQDVAETVTSAVDQILEAELRRDLAEIRASYRQAS